MSLTSAKPFVELASSAGATPFVVAHRAGNDVTLARAAQALGAGVIEADVHLYAGRLEVRHLKTAGPLPFLWDRWKLASRRTPRFLLDELLEAIDPESGLMLDLKGRDPRLPALVGAALARGRWRGTLTVCARCWPLLDLLPALPGLRRVHSVGTRRQLEGLRRRTCGRRIEGVSVHRRLLDRDTVADLRGWADLVMTWPVETPAQARELFGWGVQGLITEHHDVMTAALPRPAPVVA